MNYLRPMIILESLKTPPRLCTIDFNLTKDFARKYKGNKLWLSKATLKS